MSAPWYNADKVRQPGAAVLNAWRAEHGPEAVRSRSQVQNAAPISQITSGTELFGYFASNTAAGMAVNEKSALSVGAVYACVQLIAGAVASLPLHLFERTPEQRTRIDVQSNTVAAGLWWLLNEQPNSAMSAAVFWEYLLTAELLHSDGFAWIERRGPTPQALWPLHPLTVTVTRSFELRQLIYTFPDPHTLAPRTVTQDDMLHIPGIGFDGLRGMSRLRYAARAAIGIALAADQYQSDFFGNGARPDFVLQSDAKISQEQADVIRATWYNRFQGPGKAHLPAVLGGGLKVEPINITAEDAQLIATRQFQVVDIARIFGVPPHMIGENEKQSSWGSGIEAMSMGFVKYTLQRHLTKIEQELNRKLFPRTTKWFGEFAVDGLLRGDSTARSTLYRSALGGAGSPAWMTPNEVRSLENLPPIAGGEKLTSGMNDPAASTPPPA